MRSKRRYRFKKLRRRKARRIILFAVVMPSMMILLGYLVASVFILPSIAS